VGGRLNVATSVPTYLEFTSVESDKASALAFLCQRLGIPQDQCVAVGDGRNDLSMIAWAGLGIAVEGSPPEVIAAADRTIPGPGVAASSSWPICWSEGTDWERFCLSMRIPTTRRSRPAA